MQAVCRESPHRLRLQLLQLLHIHRCDKQRSCVYHRHFLGLTVMLLCIQVPAADPSMLIRREHFQVVDPMLCVIIVILCRCCL
jgi:hypothetical protein